MNNMLGFTKLVFNNQWNLNEEKIGTNFWNTLYINNWNNGSKMQPIVHMSRIYIKFPTHSPVFPSFSLVFPCFSMFSPDSPCFHLSFLCLAPAFPWFFMFSPDSPCFLMFVYRFPWFSLFSGLFLAGLPSARSARETEPHTHGIWSTSFRLVVTWLTERTYVRVYRLYG